MEDWERMVGRLILKTGEIEFILSQLNWNLSIGENPDEFELPDKFSGRVKRAIPIVENSFIDAPFKKEISRALHDCLKLSKIRNIVAHNSVYMEAYIDSPFAVKYKKVIGTLTGPTLCYQKLCEAVSQAEELVSKLSQITGDSRIWQQKRA